MPIQPGELSPELLAGQSRLLELRQKFEKRQAPDTQSVDEINHGRAPTLSQNKSLTIPNLLPSHLGWGNQRLTAVVRATVKNRPAPTKQPGQIIQPINQAESNKRSAKKATIKLYPDLVIGFLKAEKEAIGRIWLILRHLDSDGRGWLTIEEAKQKLSQNSSDLRVCGWRQLRNLLNRGETIFWHRNNGRIWLQSVTKVAAALDIPRLRLRPVILPIEILTKTIGKVRAHFYATFHSSRPNSTKTTNLEKPISRTTISQITHVQARTQRRYEKIARVRKQSNYAVAGKASPEKLEAASWQRGHACFKLTDFKGCHGKPGRCYVAWQLPNSYSGPHQPAPKGKQKRINQALSDLFMKGMTGNGQSRFEKRYFANGRLAAKVFNRQSDEGLYWYDHQLKMWHFLKH